MSQASLVQFAQSPQVSIIQGQPMTTSLNVAEVFGKRHNNVLRDIENILTQVSEIFGKLNFELTEYVTKNNLGFDVKDPMYNLTFDGFVLLVMGYTGKKAMQFKIAYIEEFNRMRGLLDVDGTNVVDLTPTTREDRKQLSSLVQVWMKKSRTRSIDCWVQVNSHLGIKTIKELPVEWIPRAVAFVQERIDMHHVEQNERQKALPSTHETKSALPAMPEGTQEKPCPLAVPVFTDEELKCGGHMLRLFEKHFKNLDAVIRESENLYQHFRIFGNMGGRKLVLSDEVQLLFENGNGSMEMVKAAMYMSMQGLKNALRVKASVKFS